MGVFERRNQLMQILSQRRLETSSRLATALGVSKRTIMRDVDALSLDFPIGTLSGRYGGVYLMKGYRYNSYGYYLNEEQTKILENLISGVEKEDEFRVSNYERSVLRTILDKYRKNEKRSS
ncbi:MAG: HTH domain-containing protein [Clostridia bacterium]|nr:HTH domain-containing protein [Clostridia bacterium]